jgi:hypothetical protein
MDNWKLHSIAAERRARAATARELVSQLANEEARRGILQYADDLDRDVAKLGAQIAAKKPPRSSLAIDVI